MRRARGFALIDSLLAFLAISLTLAPLLVLQRQNFNAVSQSALRSRLVLLAASYAEELRQAAPVRILPPLELEKHFGPKHGVTVKLLAGAEWPQDQPARLHTILMSWRDPISHEFIMGAP